MIKTVVAAVAYMENKGWHCKLSDDNERIVRLSFKADNKESIDVLLAFDENERSVTLKCYNICKFAEEKKAAMYKLCSEVNADFRWLKFYVDESDNTITGQVDAVIQVESCGDECYELVCRSVSIVDEAYPQFMKTIWQ